MKKEFIKLAGVLCAITLVAGILLATVNQITAPKIAEAEAKAAEEAMKAVLAGAEKFEKLNENVSVALKDKDIVGYCVQVTTTGYGGDIEMIVGISTAGTVQGIEILSHSETAGLGAKVTEDDFKGQFKDKNAVLEVVKNKTSNPNQITAITGATVTSRAVTAGIDEAYNLIEKAAEEVSE